MSNAAPRLRNRRQLLQALGAGTLVGTSAFSRLARAADRFTLPFANGERPLVQYPQKRPLLVLTSRPPQLETPWEVYNEGVVTPNDAFFVRYHLAGVPTSIDPSTFRITVRGKVGTPQTPLPQHPAIVTYRQFVDGVTKPSAWPAVDVGDVALLQYTGGTTGLPKGAMLSHGNLTAAVSIYDVWGRPERLRGT